MRASIQRRIRALAHLWMILLSGVVITLLGGLVIRWLAPLSPWVETPTVQLRDPLPQSSAVHPRSTITLVFSTPMNPFTVVRSLRIDPPLDSSYQWSEDMRVLRIIPNQALQPATTYRIQVFTTAQSRWWRPLAQALDVSFVTAAQPTVQTALAPRRLDAPIVLIFSQPMIPADVIDQPALLQGVRLSPPWPLRGQWLDQRTLLLQPTIAFTAASTYTLTVDSTFSDAQGIELGQPFRWQFTTPWPNLIEQTPPPEKRWVNPQQPLVLVFDAPVDTRLLSTALDITPSISGSFTSATTNNRYTVTFTPYTGWVPGQTYQVQLRIPNTTRLLQSWRFYVEPEPTLLASFPGQGQVLMPDQEIRLLFSTPMDESELRAGLSFEPPVDEFKLTVEENRVIVQPVIQAATTYTMTIAAGVRDHSGVPLRMPVSLTVRTASRPPLFRVPGDVLQHFPVNASPAIVVERTNLRAFQAHLYQLDTTTLIRALSLHPDEWSRFVPERYVQTPVRVWRETLNDPPDSLVRSVFAITANSSGELLPAGAYYLRLTTDSGLRVDRLLLISSMRLTVIPNSDELLVWVTKSGSGAPLSDIPLSIYLDETMLASGKSNEQGLWRVPLANLRTFTGGSAGRTLVAVAEDDGIALSSIQLLDTFTPPVKALVAVDRLSYRPGSIVRVNGLVREQQANGRLTLPAPRTCRLTLNSTTLISDATAVTCTISDKGILNGSLRLDARTAPGTYIVQVAISDTIYQIPIRVTIPTTGATIHVTPTRPTGLAVDVTRANLPISGAVISWNLRLETLSIVELDGIAGEVLGSASETSSSATTDQSGRVQINLPADENLIRPLRYELHLTAQLPDGEQLQQNTSGIIHPRSPRLSIDAPTVIAQNERATITFTLQNAEGQPLSNTLIELEVRRQIGDPPLIMRRVRTDQNGQATTALVPLLPGRYELSARSGSSVSRRQLWVAGSGIASSEPWLIPDRTAYSVGDTARLLVNGPTSGTLLLIVGQGETARIALTRAQAGNMMLLPITDDLPPLTTITALIDDGVKLWTSTVSLYINPPSPPQIALSQREVLPGSTLTLTTTASTANLFVVLTPIHAPTINLDDWNRPLTSSSSFRQGLSGIILPATPESTDQQHRISVRLPQQPGRWYLNVIAIDDRGFATATSTLIDTIQSVEAIATPLPPLRTNDTAVATLILRNIDREARTVRTRLWVSGGILLDPIEQIVTIPEHTVMPIHWNIQPQPDVALIGLRYEVIDTAPLPPIEYAIPVIRESFLPQTTQTRLVNDSLELSLADDEHEIIIAANARSALADQAQRLFQTTAPTAESLAAAIIIGNELQRTASTTTEVEYWQTAIDGSLRQLRTLRNPDGGWGWWPDHPSDPFITAFVLEAIAKIDRRDGQNPLPGESAIRYLQRERSALPLDVQSYIDYVLAKHGINDHQEPASDNLTPTARAFTALRLRQYRNQLLAQFWTTAGSGLPWAGAEGMPASALAVSASIIQALAEEQPTAPKLTTWRTALLRRWQGEGWPTPYEAARVALALGPMLSANGAEVTVWHNNDRLTEAQTLTNVERWRLRGGTLRIEPTNGPALIAIRRATAEHPQIEAIQAQLRYHQSINPLTIDQPVQVDLILIVKEPFLRLDVTIPLPAGLTPIQVDSGATLAYSRIERERRTVRFGGVNLTPGVYRLTVTARTTTAGHFQTPPAIIATPGSGLPELFVREKDTIIITTAPTN